MLTLPRMQPAQVPMKSMINNCTQGGSLVAGILSGDVSLIGRSLDSDVIIEPTRAPLIPGMMAVKAAAKAAGAAPCGTMSPCLLPTPPMRPVAVWDMGSGHLQLY